MFIGKFLSTPMMLEASSKDNIEANKDSKARV